MLRPGATEKLGLVSPAFCPACDRQHAPALPIISNAALDMDCLVVVELGRKEEASVRRRCRAECRLDGGGIQRCRLPPICVRRALLFLLPWVKRIAKRVNMRGASEASAGRIISYVRKERCGCCRFVPAVLRSSFNLTFFLKPEG